MAALFFAACSDDDASTPDNILRHDGENATGPLLDAGEHELAVHFSTSKMAGFSGKQLTEVEFFVGEPLPQNCKVRVYKGGTASPTTQVYEFDVTSGLQTRRWNKHKLTAPVELAGEDLWLGIFIVHAAQQQSIGCDSGPRKNGGDWLFSASDGEWKTYFDRTPTKESVNWNIRGKVD